MTFEEAVQNVMCGKCIPYRKETKGKLNEILQENAELKRLLKLAVEDFEIIANEIRCYNCDFNFMCCYCPLNTDNGNFSSKGWKHADEAMTLIGGNEEEN